MNGSERNYATVKNKTGSSGRHSRINGNKQTIVNRVFWYKWPKKRMETLTTKKVSIVLSRFFDEYGNTRTYTG